MSDFALGFSCCLVSACLFGCMFVPLKKTDSKDGIFVQWVMCAAVFVVGLFVNIIRHNPEFYVLPMLGGALWTIGNATAVPIIQVVGMGLGIMIWSTTCLLSGWAAGRFGWFGTTAQVPINPVANYVGVVLSVMGGLVFLFVKSTGRHSTSSPDSLKLSNTDRILESADIDEQLSSGSPTSVYRSDEDPLITRGTDGDRKYLKPPPSLLRIIGLITALVAGVFYGLTFTPVVYIQNHRNDSINYPAYVTAPNNGLDYVFSHFTGIFLTSTILMLLYCVIKRNQPVVIPGVILPAYISGTMWGVAQVSFFVANDSLDEAVSFPIITRLPGLIAAFLGVFVYREIRGRKNLSILLCASFVTIVAGVLCGLSNVNASWLK